MEEITLSGDSKYDILGCLKPYISYDKVEVRLCVDPAKEGGDETVMTLMVNNELKGVKGEVVIIDDLEPIEPDYAAIDTFVVKNYAADLEHCQPSAADWFDGRRHSKCKKHRREARGWR